MKLKSHIIRREGGRVTFCGREVNVWTRDYVLVAPESEATCERCHKRIEQRRARMAREAEETSESDPTPSQVAGYMH